MDLSLDTYIKKYKLIDTLLCDQLVSNMDSRNWEQHTFYNAAHNSLEIKSGDKELDISWGSTDKTTESKLIDCIKQSITNYLCDIDFHWFQSTSGFTFPRFNRYSETRKMAEHCDHIQSIFDGQNRGVPILTVLGSLNDNYTGGELVFFDDKQIELDKGEIMLFPSNFLYPHKVDPVQTGVRYSFVTWVW